MAGQEDPPPRAARKPVAGIKDVARVAGVSVGTVSNVLNYPEKVSDNTRTRVEAVIARIGFVRNSAAAGMRRGRSQLIGLVVPDVTNPFFAEVAKGAVDTAFAAGYVVVLCNSDGDPAREARYLAVLEEQRVAGVLLNPVGKVPHTAIDSLRVRSSSIVFIDRAVPRNDACSVSVNDVLGGYEAVLHLLELGARRIALINGPTSLRQCLDRRRGAERAIKEFAASGATLIQEASQNMSVAGGHDAAARLLSRSESVDGVFCTNDLMAIGASRAFGGIARIPEDVLMVGYDDIPLALEQQTPLTSVSQPKFELGKAGCELLLREIEAEDEHKHVRLAFEPTMMIRGSTERAQQAVGDLRTA